MKKYKIISLVMATILCFNITGVCRAESNNSWTISYVDGDNLKKDRTKYYANITDQSDIDDGESLLLINYGGTPEEGMNDYVEIKTQLKGELEVGSNYVLELSAKGAFFNKTSKTGFGSRYPQMAEFKVGDNTFLKTDLETVVSDANGWYTYKKEFTYTGTGNYFAIRVYGGLGEGDHITAFDNISLYPNGESTNLISDSTFDNKGKEDDGPYDLTEYRAKDFFAYPDGGVATVGWTNPKTSELSKIMMYERIDGARTLLKTDFSTEPEFSTVYKFGSVDENTTLESRLFEIVFTFKSKPSLTYYLTLSPTDTQSVEEELGFNWKVGKNITGMMTPARYSERRAYDNPYSGNSYLNMNLAPGTGAMDISSLMSIPFTKTPEVGKNYRLSMYLRTNDSFNTHLFFGGEPTQYAIGDPSVYQLVWDNKGGNNHDWELYETDVNIEVDADNMFFIHYNSNLCVDNVSLCKINEDGSLGENIIYNGDCEALGNTDVGILSNAEFTDIDKNSMTLRYIPEEQNISYVKLYKKIFDEFEYCGKISPKVNEIQIDNLEMDQECEYKLVPYNADDIEGIAVDVYGKTLMPEYEISEFTLSKNGKNVSNISDAGAYTLSTKIKDYLVDDMKYTQLVAVYKDNTLQKLYTNSELLSAGNKEAKAVTVTTKDIIIGTGTGWTIEVYAWDTAEDMNILKSCSIFSQIQ